MLEKGQMQPWNYNHTIKCTMKSKSRAKMWRKRMHLRISIQSYQPEEPASTVRTARSPAEPKSALPRTCWSMSQNPARQSTLLDTRSESRGVSVNCVRLEWHSSQHTCQLKRTIHPDSSAGKGVGKKSFGRDGKDCGSALGCLSSNKHAQGSWSIPREIKPRASYTQNLFT